MRTITHNLTRLISFSGRQPPRIFWPYAGFVVGLSFVASFALVIPVMASTFERMQKFAEEHPDQATVTRGPGHYSIQIEGYHPELVPDFGTLIAGFGVIAAAAAVLLAAAVARRLHDRGRSGFWGAMPLPFLATGMTLLPGLFRLDPPDFTLFGLLFLNNLVYLVSLAVLVVMLARRGDPEENRYGPPFAG